jgi:hypothetical protein
VHSVIPDIVKKAAIDDTIVGSAADIEADGTEVREGTGVEGDGGAMRRGSA